MTLRRSGGSLDWVLPLFLRFHIAEYRSLHRLRYVRKSVGEYQTYMQVWSLNIVEHGAIINSPTAKTMSEIRNTTGSRPFHSKSAAQSHFSWTIVSVVAVRSNQHVMCNDKIGQRQCTYNDRHNSRLQIHWFIDLFIHSFIHSSIRSFIHSFIHHYTTGSLIHRHTT